jgi:pentatricopeptide repeat protein
MMMRVNNTFTRMITKTFNHRIQPTGVITPTTHHPSLMLNNQVRGMAWANREKKPKSKQERLKKLADFPFSKRLEHFYIYKKEGHLPNMHFDLYKEFLYYCVMEAISDSHSVEKAFEIAKAAVEEAGHELDIEAYTYLIQVCALNRRVEDAERLWKEMDERKVEKSNQQIYGAMLRVYCLVDNEAKCRELHEEMLKKDLVPKFITFERLYRNLRYF